MVLFLSFAVSPENFPPHSEERPHHRVYSAFRLSFQPSQGLFLTFWHANQSPFSSLGNAPNSLQPQQEFSSIAQSVYSSPSILSSCPHFIVPYSVVSHCHPPLLFHFSLQKFLSQPQTWLISSFSFSPAPGQLHVTRKQLMDTWIAHNLKWSQVWGCPSVLFSKPSALLRSAEPLDRGFTPTWSSNFQHSLSPPHLQLIWLTFFFSLWENTEMENKFLFFPLPCPPSYLHQFL